MDSKASSSAKTTSSISHETHLNDRKMFDLSLGLQVDIANKSGLPFAVMLIDVVCIESPESHKFMLGGIYKSLKAHKFDRDFVGCLEGGVQDHEGYIRNRYGIITGDIKKLSEVSQIVAKFFNSIREACLSKTNSDLDLQIKTGVALYPEDVASKSSEDLYRNAASALDKATGMSDSKSAVVFCNSALNQAFAQTTTI